MSYLRLYLGLVFIFLALCICPRYSAGANEGFQPVNPEELKMTNEPLAPGAPAINLFRQVDRDDNGRTSHEYNYFRIKILTEEGRKYADVEIPFFQSEGDIVNIKARTIRPDGSVINFDGKVYDKSIAKAKGFKYLAKTFTLPEVQVGGVIEYFYTKDLPENFIYDSHWILSDELFTKEALFTLKPYKSDYQNFSLRWTWQGLPPGTAPVKNPDGNVKLETKNIPAFVIEDYMPPQNEMKSRVDFVYSDEPFEANPDKFWKSVGKKLNDRVEGFVGKRKAMEQAVSQIISPSDSPEVKLQKIYARVQQFRNTSYEELKTEQEKNARNKKKQPTWKSYGSKGTEMALR